MSEVWSTRSAAPSIYAARAWATLESLRWPLTRTALQAAAMLAGAIALAAAPIWVLVCGALQLHLGRGWNPWLALTGGALAAASLLGLYGGWLTRTFTGRFRFRLVAARISLPMVVLLCAYSLALLPEFNAKNERIHEDYRQLHPILRVAVGIYGFLDGDFVLTDLTREPRDYAPMGLEPPTRSLHYVQADGVTHALDLRTKGRGRVRNTLAQLYFEALGFETLRHVGTADHLHVGLPVLSSYAAPTCDAVPNAPGAYCSLD